MQVYDVTRLSSKGQVVIPRKIPDVLGLFAGETFLVMGEDDRFIFKRMAIPRPKVFRALAARSRKAALRTGLRKEDIGEAIRRVRR
jgi:bifunctional DNA-binding transcriptional regulator/antitoxin component of YhaV-PrlF toxin-antitoxin module